MSPKLSKKSFTFDAIGTHWVISINQLLGQEQLLSLKEKIIKRVDVFDATYSRFRDDSLVSKISHQAGKFKFPADAKTLFEMYRKLYNATSGKITLLIGNLLDESGYNAEYSLKPDKKINKVLKMEDVLFYKHPYLTTAKPTIIDFGAVGKGYLIDILGQLLRKEGIHSFFIDAGGDMLRSDKKNRTINIGLENPLDATEAIGIAKLGNGSLCGSAGSRRKWAGIHHIMDPDSAESIQNILATWVTANDAISADGLATSLFFTKASKLQQSFSFEYCLMRSDLSVEYSNNFPAQLFVGDKEL